MFLLLKPDIPYIKLSSCRNVSWTIFGMKHYRHNSDNGGDNKVFVFARQKQPKSFLSEVTGTNILAKMCHVIRPKRWRQ